MMVPCLHHDIFAGCAREDMSLIINELFKRKIISKESMNWKCALFKDLAASMKSAIKMKICRFWINHCIIVILYDENVLYFLRIIHIILVLNLLIKILLGFSKLFNAKRELQSTRS